MKDHDVIPDEVRLELEKRFGKKPLIRMIAYSYFIEQVVNDPTIEVRKEILDLFHRVVGDAPTLWTLKVYKDEEEAFERRAKLSSTPDRYSRGIYTTTVAASDAYVKMREVDASFLDFAANHADVAKDIEIDFVQDQEGSFAQFKVMPGAQYSGLEVIGQTHAIKSVVTEVGGKYKLTVHPTALPSLAMG